MPAYADKMNAKDLDLLVQWMTGDYYETHVEDYPSRISEVFGAGNEPAAEPPE
jgi:hypothetical protein